MTIARTDSTQARSVSLVGARAPKCLESIRRTLSTRPAAKGKAQTNALGSPEDQCRCLHLRSHPKVGHSPAHLAMFGNDYSEDQRPLTHFRGYPIHAATLIVA